MDTSTSRPPVGGGRAERTNSTPAPFRTPLRYEFDAGSGQVFVTAADCELVFSSADITEPEVAALVGAVNAEPILRNTIRKLGSALDAAERFIAGFEGDEMQDGIDRLLDEIRLALKHAPVEGMNQGYLIASCTSEVEYAGHTLRPVLFRGELRNGKLSFFQTSVSKTAVTGDCEEWDPFEESLPGTGSLFYDEFVFVDEDTDTSYEVNEETGRWEPTGPLSIDLYRDMIVSDPHSPAPRRQPSMRP